MSVKILSISDHFNKWGIEVGKVYPVRYVSDRLGKDFNHKGYLVYGSSGLPLTMYDYEVQVIH